MSLINYLDDMALAIKEKSGYKGKMTYVEMPEKIRELAFEDPMTKYADDSVLLKNGTTWTGEQSNVAILGVSGSVDNPTYTKYDYLNYNSSGEVVSRNVAVVNTDDSPLTAINTLDLINNTYVIHNVGNDGQTATDIFNPNTTYGLVYVDMLSDAKPTPLLKTSANYGETILTVFSSGMVSTYNVNTTDGSIFYPAINSSNELYYDYISTSENSGTFIGHISEETINDIYYIDDSRIVDKGIGFMYSSGTLAGYNPIQYIDKQGSEQDLPDWENDFTSGDYTIYYNSSIGRFEMVDYGGPNLDNNNLYYYYIDSSDETHYDKVELSDSTLYVYEGSGDFNAVTFTGATSGKGLYFYNNNTYNPVMTGYQGLVYYFGSGGVESVKNPQLETNYLYSYNGAGEFTRANIQLEDDGGIYFYVNSSGKPTFTYQENIGLDCADGLYYWDGYSSFTWKEGLIYTAGSGSYPENVELDQDYLYMYNGGDDFIKAEGLSGSGIYYYDGNYNFEEQNLNTYHVYQYGYGCGPELTEIANGIYEYTNGTLTNYTNQDGTYLIYSGQLLNVPGDSLSINNLYWAKDDNTTAPWLELINLPTTMGQETTTTKYTGPNTALEITVKLISV